MVRLFWVILRIRYILFLFLIVWVLIFLISVVLWCGYMIVLLIVKIMCFFFFL